METHQTKTYNYLCFVKVRDTGCLSARRLQLACILAKLSSLHNQMIYTQFFIQYLESVLPMCKDTFHENSALATWCDEYEFAADYMKDCEEHKKLTRHTVEVREFWSDHDVRISNHHTSEFVRKEISRVWICECGEKFKKYGVGYSPYSIYFSHCDFYPTGSSSSTQM